MKRILTSKSFQVLLLLSILISATLLMSSNSRLNKTIQNYAFDAFNRWDERPASNDVIIVDIDEASLGIIGQWPWPRDIIATMISNLHKLGARSVSFDMVFAEEDRTSKHLLTKHLQDNTDVPKNVLQQISDLPNHDQLLADTFKKTKNVVTAFTYAHRDDTRRMPPSKHIAIRKKDYNSLARTIKNYDGVATNIPLLSKNSSGSGSFMATPDHDGIIRKINTIIGVPDLKTNQTILYPTLGLESLRVAHNPKDRLQIANLKNKSNLPSDFLQKFSNANNYTVKISTSPWAVNINSHGLVYLKFRKLDRKKDYIPAHEIINQAHSNKTKETIKNKIVLIGTSAEGLRDIRNTAIQAFIPGVEVHFNFIEQVLQDSFLYRDYLVSNGIEGIIFNIIGLTIIIFSLYSGVVFLTSYTTAMISIINIAAWLSYTDYNLLFDSLTPSISLIILFVTASLMNYLRSESMAKEIRGAFGLYISPDFMEELTDNPDKLKLGGEMRELSVLFTDIRNFTTISESMTPEELINTMNDFLTPMSDEVMNHRGTIDKYMGDAMMAFWNAPLDDADHAKHAVQAALKMKSSLIPVNKALADKAKKEGREPLILAAGMGINTGLCSVGNMGSKQRFAYSALGDAVNLASRLEGQTKSYGLELLVGEETVTQIPKFAHVEIDKIQVKGKTKPVRIFTVLGDEDIGRKTSFRKFKIAHRRFIRDYRAQRFEDAAVKLQDLVINKYATDLKTYYTIMMDRMEDFQKNTPPRDWDGVYVATSK